MTWLDDVEARLKAAMLSACSSTASDRRRHHASLNDVGPLMARVRAADALYEALDKWLELEDDRYGSMWGAVIAAHEAVKAARAGDREGSE